MEQVFYIIPRGLAIGILISAPMGPIGMFIIQRTLSKGRWPAFYSGIGAAVSDLFYCLLTGLGLSFVTDFIEAHQILLKVVGAVVLGIFGIYVFRKNPTQLLLTAKDAGAQSRTRASIGKDVATGFALTVSNPLILFFITGLFASFNYILPEYQWGHVVLAYAVILGGALLWWWFVTTLVSVFRSRFNVRSLWLVNRIIGCILMGMAAVGVIMAASDFINHL